MIKSTIYFRLVMMGKLHLRTAAKEKRSTETSPIHRHKNRAGIIETRAAVCAECGEEFCGGSSCGEFLYESYTRTDIGTIHVDPTGNDALPGKTASPTRGKTKSGKKKKKKARSSKSGKKKKKGKGKGKGLNKSTEKEKM